MMLVYKSGNAEIYEFIERHGSDFYVYHRKQLVRVCPSIGMAREIAAGHQ